MHEDKKLETVSKRTDSQIIGVLGKLSKGNYQRKIIQENFLDQTDKTCHTERYTGF